MKLWNAIKKILCNMVVIHSKESHFCGGILFIIYQNLFEQYRLKQKGDKNAHQNYR